MKRFNNWAILSLFLSLSLSNLLHADSAGTTNEDFSSITNAVLKLVQTGDTNQFAKTVSASMTDFQKVTIKTNVQNPFNADFKRQRETQQKELAASAQAFGKMQSQLHIPAAQMQFTIKETHNTGIGSIMYDWAPLPWCSRLTIVLHGEPLPGADAKLRGDYIIAMSGLVKLPSGWRAEYASVRWTKFPDALADANTLLEIRLAEIISEFKPLTDVDDPTLRQLGTNVIPFLRERDDKVFVSKAMLSFETAWQGIKQKDKSASRKDFEEGWKWFTDKSLAAARTMAQQAKDWGIDFEKAEINLKSVTAKNLMHRGTPGSSEDIEANEAEFIFDVRSNEKSKTGQSLSGEYAVVAQRVHRNSNDWKIEGEIRWKKLPSGVLTQADADKVQFEDYVAEHGVFPLGTVVPDIEFTRLDNGQKQKLSDHRGKIVLLDFWSTSCGPCQQPLEQMQQLIKDHKELTNRVSFLSLSIDDTEKQVSKHLKSRGWTNSVNCWAGPGGWDAEPAKQFHIQMLPTMYLIGKDGKVIQSGHLDMGLLYQRLAAMK